MKVPKIYLYVFLSVLEKKKKKQYKVLEKKERKYYTREVEKSTRRKKIYHKIYEEIVNSYRLR